MGEPISREEWEKGYENRETLYVNYQYHKDVCAKSIERAKMIESLELQLAEARAEIERLKGAEPKYTTHSTGE